MLDVIGLKKTYQARGRTVEALGDLTFRVEAHELVCIVGPSGCGKTTLLKCIAGLLKPTSGDVVLHGDRVTGPPPDMAVVFQEYGRSLFPWMTVRQNVELPLREKKLPRKRREQLVSEALAAVDMSHAQDAHPWQLSGGMQQRVAIARAIAFEPQVLLMDEPFAAVDAQTRADLEDLIRQLWHRFGVTTVFVTHDIDEAVYLGQRVIMLSSSPTTVLEDLIIDLPDERDQIGTRSTQRFAELRTQVYAQIQRAKRDRDLPSGAAPASAGLGTEPVSGGILRTAGTGTTGAGTGTSGAGRSGAGRSGAGAAAGSGESRHAGRRSGKH